MRRLPIVTSHTAGWKAAKKAARSKAISPTTPRPEMKQQAMALAHSHTHQMMSTRAWVTPVGKEELSSTFVEAFLDGVASAFKWVVFE